MVIAVLLGRALSAFLVAGLTCMGSVPAYSASAGTVQSSEPELSTLALVRANARGEPLERNVIFRRGRGYTFESESSSGAAAGLPGVTRPRCSSAAMNSRGEQLLTAERPSSNGHARLVLIDGRGRKLWERASSRDANRLLALGDDGSVFRTGSRETGERPYIERLR